MFEFILRYLYNFYQILIVLTTILKLLTTSPVKLNSNNKKAFFCVSNRMELKYLHFPFLQRKMILQAIELYRHHSILAFLQLNRLRQHHCRKKRILTYYYFSLKTQTQSYKRNVVIKRLNQSLKYLKLCIIFYILINSIFCRKIQYCIQVVRKNKTQPFINLDGFFHLWFLTTAKKIDKIFKKKKKFSISKKILNCGN